MKLFPSFLTLILAFACRRPQIDSGPQSGFTIHGTVCLSQGGAEISQRLRRYAAPRSVLISVSLSFYSPPSGRGWGRAWRLLPVTATTRGLDGRTPTREESRLTCESRITVPLIFAPHESVLRARLQELRAAIEAARSLFDGTDTAKPSPTLPEGGRDEVNKRKSGHHSFPGPGWKSNSTLLSLPPLAPQRCSARG